MSTQASVAQTDPEVIVGAVSNEWTRGAGLGAAAEHGGKPGIRRGNN
jgi:hypothetical protein